MQFRNWLRSIRHRSTRTRRRFGRRPERKPLPWQSSAFDHSTILGELLEDRTLLTDTTVTLVAGLLTISDTNAVSNDDLDLSYNAGVYTLTDNGGVLIDVSSIAGSTGNNTATVTFPDTGITSVLFDTQGGDDTVTVSSLQANYSGDFVITGGAGTDAANVLGNINTTTGTGGVDLSAESINLSANVLTDGGAVSFTGQTTVTTSAIIETEVGDDGDAGNVTFDTRLENATGVNAIDITVDASTASGNGGDITLPGGVFNPGAGNFNDIVLNSSGTGTVGVVALGGDIQANDDDDLAGGDTGSLTIIGDLRLTTSVSFVVSDSNDSGASVDLSDATVSATVGNVNLLIDTRHTGGAALNGGNVELGVFSNAGGQNVNNLSVDTTTNGAGVGGDVTFEDDVVLDGNLVVDSNSITMSVGATATLNGASSANLTTDQGVQVNSGAALNVVNGAMQIDANQGGTPTPGDFIGVEVIGGSLNTSGSGNIVINARGGDDAGNDQYGVRVSTNGKIRSTSTASNAGSITVVGTGNGTGSVNMGVRVSGSTVEVTSVNGDISLTGTGGPGNANHGLFIDGGADVTTTGTGADAGNITLIGNGGVGANNAGVVITDNGTLVQTVDGDITLTAVASGASAIGLSMQNSTLDATGDGDISIDATPQGGQPGVSLTNAKVGNSVGTGNLSIKTDTTDMGGSTVLDGQGQLTIEPRTNGTTLGIGNAATGTLNLTAAEIGLISDGFTLIQLGNANTGNVDANAATFADSIVIEGATISVTGLNVGPNTASLLSSLAVTDGGNLVDDVTAASLRIDAQTGIGSGDALETAADGVGPLTLAAQTDSNNIELSNRGPLLVSVVSGLAGVTILDASNANGAANIDIATQGSFTVLNSISNNDGGDILLTANGNTNSDDLNVAATLSANGGNGSITLSAGNDIATSSLVGTFGNGDVTYNAGVSTNDGVISMSGSGISVSAGNVSLDADGLATLAPIASTSNGSVTVVAGDVAVTATVSTGGSVELKPADPTSSIGIGGGAGAFNVDDADIANLSGGSLQIGDLANGSGTVSIDTAAIGTPVTIAGGVINDAAVGTDLSLGANGVTFAGTVAPGLASTPGILVVNGDLTLMSTETLQIEIGGAIPGTAAGNYDQIQVDGNNRTINIASATLDTSLVNGFVPTLAGQQEFRIVDSTGTGSNVVGTLSFGGNPLNDGDTFAVGATTFQINYNPVGGAGDVVLIEAGNTAPTINNLAGDVLSFIEGQAAQVLDQGTVAVVTDAENNWNAGTLTIQISANAEAGDEISIQDVGNITVNQANGEISSSGVHFATANVNNAIVVNNNTLTITFNANATNVRVAELLSAVSYRTTVDDPGLNNRSVNHVLTDSASLSANAAVTVQVTGVNNAPIRTAGTVGPISVLEDSSNITATTLGLAAVDYSAIEAGQTLTYQITAIPAFVNVFKSDGTTPVVLNDFVTLIELRGLTYKTILNSNGTGNITFNVMDNGGQLNGGADLLTENLNITVAAVNDDPVLGAIANQVVNELTLLTFTASAFDPDLPADTLTFTLDAASLANGMTINALTGVFAWTPIEAQGASVFNATITVDDGVGGSDFQTFQITVNEINVDPVLAAIGNKTVDEQTQLAFTVSATDVDLPANTLTFSLDAASLGNGMSINASTGAFTWTPTEAQGPGIFNATITVDDGVGGSDFETIQVTVNEANVDPVLAPIGNRAVVELNALAFTAVATDADIPANTLTFSLDAASLANGMSINASTGAFTWTPTEAQGPGVFNATITVDDGVGGSDFETIQITVSDTNVDPVLAAIGNQTVAELVQLTFIATATDADVPANTLTFSLDATSIANGMTINASTGAFSWTPTEAQGPGVFNATITVDDGLGGSDFETIQITVGEVNVDPVLNVIGNQTVNELTQLAFTATATDVDLPANTLTFSLDATSLANGMSINVSTGAFTWTPTEAQGPGIFTTTITVDDGVGGSDSETIQITVNDVNVDPVLNAIGNQVVDELTPLAFTATATDIDLPANTLVFSLDAAALADGMSINATTGAFTWTPTEAQGPGVFSATITVVDGAGGSDFETIQITVNEVNVDPVLATIGNQTVNELTQLAFTATATDVDLPANTLSFSLDATSLANGMSINAATGAFTWTPTEAQGPGIFNTMITVDDGVGGTDFETIQINVNEVNVDPVLAAIGNQTTNEQALLTFTASATDADLPANTLTFSLDATSIANGMTINASTGVFAWTPNEIQGPGVFNATITVDDGAGGSDLETIQIAVNEVNTPPVLTAIGNQTITELTQLTFVASATDTDLPANTLTFSLDAASLANGMLINATTGVFTWTPTEAQGPGVFNATITVSDGVGGTDFETIQINVDEANVDPVLVAIGNQSVDEQTQLAFTASATDVDLPANTLTFSLDATSIANGMAINGVSGAFTWTPTEAQGPGVYNATITVDDGVGGTDFETIQITVNEANVDPVLAVIGNQTVNEETLLTFTAAATDADIPANTLTFSLDAAALANGMTINASTGVFAWTPLETQGPGVFNATITVSDGVGGSDFETIQITVNEVNVAPFVDLDVSGAGTGFAVGVVAGTGPLVITDVDAIVNDVDLMDFNGGSLTVTISSGGDNTEDVLSIVDQGVAFGLIGFSAGTVTFSGNVIGTATGGSNGNPLTINFTTANATEPAVEALLRNITYENIDLLTPTLTNRMVDFVVSDGDGGTSNTATSDVTVTALLVTFDYGDAPNSAQSGFANTYPVTLAENGARSVGLAPILGALIDIEPNPSHSANADSDDLNNLDDEDGVTFVSSIVSSASNDTEASVVVKLGTAGVNNFLSGWIDFNRDGDWADAGEQIFNDVVLMAGDNTLNFTVPLGADSGSSYARFRVSDEVAQGVTGPSMTGEIEDYAVTLLAAGGTTPAVLDLPDGTGDIEMTDIGGDLVIRRESDNLVLFRSAPIDIQSLTVNGTSAAETLTLRARGANPFPVDGVTFNGNDPIIGPGDTVRIEGDAGTSIASGVYTPDIATTGDGVHDLVYTDASTGRLTFTGLEPTEVSAIPVYTLTTAGSVDLLDVNGGLASGGQPAVVVTGSSDGVAIESLTIFDVANFIIDTATNDGVAGGSGSDSINILAGLNNGTDLGQGIVNVSIQAGIGGTGDADVVTVDAVVDLPGAFTIDEADNVDINFDIDAGTSLTISNVNTEIDLAANVDLAANNGDLDLLTGVNSIDLSGAGGINRLIANDPDASGDGNIATGPITDNGTPGAVVIDADNAVSVDSIDVQATISILANQDNVGAEGFSHTGDIVTSDDTASAVSIVVNTFMGGTGDANIGGITTGTTSGPTGGRVTISTMGGSIVDVGVANATNIISGNAVLSGAAVGTFGNRIETTISRLEGSGGAGGFFLRDDANLTIGGVDVGTVGIVSTSGDIDIRTAGGSLVVEEDILSSAAGNIALKTDDTAALGDDLTVNAAVSINTNGAGNVLLEAGDNVTLTATSSISAGGTISITGDCNDADFGVGVTLTIAAQLTAGGGTTINGGSDDDTFDFFYPSGATNSGVVTIADPGGTDDVLIHGTADDEELFLTTSDPPTTPLTERVTRGTATDEPVIIPCDVEAVSLLGGDGNDTFHVEPSMLWPVTIDGQNPTFGQPGVPPGDSLDLNTFGNAFTINGKTIFVADGSPDPFTGITFTNIESVPLNPSSVGPDQRFDFNAPAGNGGQTPTQNGFTGVTPDTLFTPGNFGWQLPISSFPAGLNTGPAANLLNDGHSFTPGSGAVTNTFTTTVGNGWVLVTVAFGNKSAPIDGMQIENADDGSIVASDLSTAAGESDHVSFLVLVEDGTLDLRFRDPFANAQGRRLVAINGIDIDTDDGGQEPSDDEDASQGQSGLGFLSMGFATPGTLDADGTTVDTFLLDAAPPNSLVTVETSLGTVVGVDADPRIDGFQVFTDDAGQANIMIQRPSAAGDALVSLTSVTGRKTGCVVVNYGQVNARNFDFDSGSSNTFSPFDAVTNPNGYLSVGLGAAFSATTGFGWTSASPDVFLLDTSVGGPLADLYDDGHTASDARTFRTELDNGTYQVSVLAGNNADHQSVSIAANGQVVVDSQTITRRQFFETVFTVVVSSGQLDLTFSQNDNVFGDPHWIVNAISIRPTTLVNTITPAANLGNVQANGTASSSLAFNTTASDGTLLTVSSTLGSITTADADPNTVGTQVVVDGGMVSFELLAGHKSGTPTIEMHSIDGAHRGTISDAAFLDFVVPILRQFDFVDGSRTGTSSAVAAGFTAVHNNDKSPTTFGFGFADNNVKGFAQTGNVANVTNDDLYRDGLRLSGGAETTFQVDAKLATDYDIRVYIGSPFLEFDGIEVTAEGAGTVVAANTMPGEFTIVTLSNADDANGDGLIDITFRETSTCLMNGLGIVGLEIVESSTGLPVPETLLAGEAANDGLAETISVADLSPAISVATISLLNQLDLAEAQVDSLLKVEFVVADLGDGILAELLGDTVFIDDNGAGSGWDTILDTPLEENQFDILTAVAHELGHLIGLPHSENVNDVMGESLDAGVRKGLLAGIDNFFDEAVQAMEFFE